MSTKPQTRDGYPPELAIDARRMCLYLATILGDLMTEDIVIVGGLVPYLIIDQTNDGEGHVGTRDVDLGLSLAVFDAAQYRDISDRLRGRGFEPMTNDSGNATRQTWGLKSSSITLDFLIPPVAVAQRAGSLQDLERDFAAIVTPGLGLAFLDAVTIEIDDITTNAERAVRKVRVCGPAAFVVLKALALRRRGENKDAYDLVYMLLQWKDGIPEIASRLRALAVDADAIEALTFLREDFGSPDHVGPKRRSEFFGSDDPGVRAEAFVAVQELLRLL